MPSKYHITSCFPSWSLLTQKWRPWQICNIYSTEHYFRIFHRPWNIYMLESTGGGRGRKRSSPMTKVVGLKVATMVRIALSSVSIHTAAWGYDKVEPRQMIYLSKADGSMEGFPGPRRELVLSKPSKEKRKPVGGVNANNKKANPAFAAVIYILMLLIVSYFIWSLLYQLDWCICVSDL